MSSSIDRNGKVALTWQPVQVKVVHKPRETRITPLGGAVEQIGDAWMLMILWASYEGVTRFDDYQKRLGVARNILSNRLRRLCELHVLEKRPVREGARRLEYRITAKGEELRGPLTEIHRWGARWEGRAAEAALPLPTAAE